MPNDSGSLHLEDLGGMYTSTELYPADSVGLREVPIAVKDVYGRVIRTVMQKLTPYQYDEYIKKQRKSRRINKWKNNN